MTLIEKTLKENIDKLLTKIASDYTNYNIGVASIFERLEEELPKLLTQALQEQDRESTARVVKDMYEIANDIPYGDSEVTCMALFRSIKDYAKQHNIDLKQD